MSKKLFVETVERLFSQNEVAEEVLEYFNSTVKLKRINKKELDKSEIVKRAIEQYLMENVERVFDRVEIADELYNRAEFPEEYLLNDKGTLAYNSITAFANQLVNDGRIAKSEVKVGKVNKVKYGFIV